MTEDIKELIKDVNNDQIKDMQQMTRSLIDKIEATSVNQTMRMDDLNENISELSKKIPMGEPD